MVSKLKRILVRWIYILGILYLILLAVVFVAQRHFIFHPEMGRLSAVEIIERARAAGFVPWTNSAGLTIGVKKVGAAAPDRYRVLIVHGNAGSAVGRTYYADELKAAGGFDVYILEYPGYGAREGLPSQASLFAAADEAADRLEKEGSFYVIGESLGTGVAAYLAGTHPQTVRGIMLFAPYYDLVEVGQYQMPIFPVRLLLRDRFPAASYLEKFHGPVGVALAGQDTIIPKRFGQHLFDSYSGPKKLWEIPEFGHNELSDRPPEWWRELGEFWGVRAFPR